MANTYTLIASNTLSSNSNGVTFSSIPSTYTDLVIKISLRETPTGGNFTSFRVAFNNSFSGYSLTRISADGTSVVSARSSSQTSFNPSTIVNGPSSTSNTFSNLELYIPSYTSSANKCFSLSGVAENNATLAYVAAVAGLRSNTSAITSIDFVPNDAYLSGSSFFLYGIKNS